MAKFDYGRQIEYGIRFVVDKAALNDLQTELNKIQQTRFDTVQMKLNTTDLDKVRKVYSDVKEDAKQLQDVLNKTFNTNLGTFNLKALNTELSKINLSKMQRDFAAIGATGANAFRQIQASIVTQNSALKQSNEWLDKMATTFKNTVRYGISSSVFNNLSNSIQKAYDYTVKLDSSLNDIRIVTDKSAESMNQFALRANKAAQELGKSTRDYTDASLIFYQQGLNDEETAVRTEATLKAANVTGQSTRDVSEQLTAVWNGYRVQTAEVELYVDKLAATAAATAADLEELSTGMSKVASAANVMGVDVDQLNAQLATIVSVTREAPETIGTSLKTVYARMSDIQAGLDSETSLGKYSGKMAEFGINVLDANGKLRAMGDVVEEIGEKWSSLTREQQVSLAQIIAGQRQYSRMMSLFDNWDKYNEALAVSKNSMGTLQHQQDIYMESTQAHLQQLSTAWERVYNAMVDKDSIIGVTDGLTSIVKLIAQFTESVGGGIGVLNILGTTFTKVFSTQIARELMIFNHNIQSSFDTMRNQNFAKAISSQFAETGQGNEIQKTVNGWLQDFSKYSTLLNETQRESYGEFIKQGVEIENQVALEQERTANAEKYYDTLAEHNNQAEENAISFQNIEKEDIELTTKMYRLLEDEYALAEKSAKLASSLNNPEDQRSEEAFLNDVSRLADNLNLLTPPTEKATKELEQLKQEYESADFLENEQTVTSWISRVRNYMQEVQEASSNAKRALDRQLNGDNEKLLNSQKEYEDQLKKIKEQLEKVSVTDSVIKLTGSIGQLATAFSMIPRFKDIWTNEDLSAGEKALQITTALASFATMLGSSFKGLGSVVFNLAGHFNLLSEEELLAGKAGAAAWAKILLPIAAVAAAIAGIIALVKILIDDYNKLANAAEEAAKAAKDLQEKAQALANTQKQLETSFEAYKTAEENIENCAKGTKEWQENLETVNDTAKEVLKNLESLENINLNDLFFVDPETGKLTLNKEALADILDENSKKTTSMEMGANRASAEATKAEADAQLLAISRQINPVDFWESLSKGSSIGTAIAPIFGTGVGAGIAWGDWDAQNDQIKNTLYENLDNLLDANTTDDFRNRLENLGFKVDQITNDELTVFQRQLEDVANKEELAAQKLDAYDKLSIQELLGEDTSAATVNLVQQQMKDWPGRREGEEEVYLKSLSKMGNTSEVQYNDILRRLTDAGYTYSAGKNIIRGSGENRAFEFKNAKGEEEVISYKELANMLAQADSRQRYEELGTGYEKLWKGLESDFVKNDLGYKDLANELKEFYTSGNLENLNSSQVEDLKAWNTLTQQNNQFVSKGLGVDYGQLISSDMQKDLSEAAANYETAAQDLVSKYDDAIRMSFSQLDTSDLSLSGKKALLDTLNNTFEIEGGVALTDLTNKFKELSQEELSTYVDNLLSKELDTATQIHQLLEGEETENEYKAMGLDSKEVEGYAQYLAEVSGEVENLHDKQDDLADSMQDNAEANVIVAKSIMRMNNGIEKLSKSQEDWIDILEKSDDTSYEFYDALTDMQDAMGDLFDLSESSEKYLDGDFFINNAELIKKAAEGDAEAIDNLRAAAAQDIVINIQKENGIAGDLANQINADVLEAQSLAKDIQVGATLDSGNFMEVCQRIIDSAQMTTQQANAFFEMMGFSADVTYDQDTTVMKVPKTTKVHHRNITGRDILGNPTDWTETETTTTTYEDITGDSIPVEAVAINTKTGKPATPIIKKMTKKGTGSFNNASSSNKGGGSGGKKGGGGGKGKGGGGGSSKKADTMDPLKEEIDRYHDVNVKLEQIETTLDRLEDAEDKAFGGDLVKNYNKQIEALNNQITVTQQKLGIAADEMKELQGKLSGSGVRFNSDGTIGNYAAALKAQENYVNGIINHYNSLGADAQESYKETVEQAKENFDKFKENLERYDKLVTDEIPDLQNQIQEAIDKITEKNIEKFKMEVDLRLDMAEAERDWNEFKKKVIDQIDDDDILGNAKARIEDLRTYLNDLDTGEVQALGKHVQETLDELRAFDKGLDNVYGRERAQSLEDLEEYFDNLKDALEEIVEIQDELQEDVLDQMDAVQDKIDDQVDTFEAISDLIEHDMTLIQLTLGEDAYAELSNFYKAQQDNYNKQLDFQRQQVDYWKQQMDAVEQGSEQFDAAREKWADAVADWNDLVEDTIENLQDQLENTINAIFKNLNDNLTNNKGLQYVSDEFEVVGKRAEQFLDEINTLQGVADLADKYQDAINNTDNISAQRKLNAAMEEQLNTLKSAERLSEKDIERAQKKYDLTVAQIALEEAQAQKNTLRLRRDTQGNYRYQYVADDEAVNDAENKLKEAYNSLYNFDKERYIDNLDEALDVWNEYQEKMAEAAKINDPELAQQKALMIQQEYGDIINGIVEQNEKIRTDLRESAFMDFANLKQEEYDTYMNLTQEEQDVVVNGLIPQWEGGIQQMLNAIKDKGGFEPTTLDAFNNIKQAAEDYDAAVQDIQEDVNATVGDVLDGEDKIIAINQDLTVSNNDVVDSYKAELTAVQELAAGVNDLADAYKDELQAAKDAHDYLAKQKEEAAKAAAAAEKGKTAAKETVATPLPETKPAQTTAAPAPAQNSAPSLSKGSFVNVKAGTKWYYTSYGGRSGTARSGSIKYINLKGPYSYNIEGLGWIRKTDIVGYDTGGYTGEWNNNGKLGVLHQKELVLNAKDTKNLLDTVAIMRNITAAVGENTLQRLSGATSGSYIANGDGKGILEQDVHITANFPNVRSAIEIETALNNLTNAASQYIGKQ